LQQVFQFFPRLCDLCGLAASVASSGCSARNVILGLLVVARRETGVLEFLPCSIRTLLATTLSGGFYCPTKQQLSKGRTRFAMGILGNIVGYDVRFRRDSLDI